MQSYEAASLINDGLTFKPGWRIDAIPYGPESVQISLALTTRDSDREYAPGGYQKPTIAGGAWALSTRGSRDDVIKRLIGLLCDIDQHEHREFVRIKPSHGGTYNAPFHPHRYDGEMAWERAAA